MANYSMKSKAFSVNIRSAPQSDFDASRKYFAFSCVDLVVYMRGGFVLLRRRNSPYKGLWHLPGGIIHKGQTMLQKAEEVAKRELNCEVKVLEFIGVYENIHRYRHDVSHCFLAKVLDEDHFLENSGMRIFKNIPNDTIPYHKSILTNLSL